MPIKPSRTRPLWFRVWATPCLAHFPAEATDALAQREEIVHDAMVFILVTVCLGVAVWLYPVLLELVTNCDPSSSSLCTQWPTGVAGCHFPTCLWPHAKVRLGQANSALYTYHSVLAALGLYLLPSQACWPGNSWSEWGHSVLGIIAGLRD